MLARLQHRHRHLVVDRRIRNHVHRCDIRVGHNLVEGSEHQRRAAEKTLYFALAQIRVIGIEVTDAHQLDIADAAVF